MKHTTSSTVQQFKSEADKLLRKSLDRQVKLAVTGLSRSGKSAFITSLVHQLCDQSHNHNLPFVEVIRDNRFVGCRKIPQTSLHIPSFHYQQALDSLFGETPCWPESTRAISELRLAIRFKPNKGLLSYFSEMNTLYVDIFDYPGEWLMDLPLLEMDFRTWSIMTAKLFDTEPRKTLSANFMAKAKNLDPHAHYNEAKLAELSNEYSELLLSFKKQHGISLLQPGRFILPGELEGAPILQFIPMLGYVSDSTWDNMDPKSNLGVLFRRFEAYKAKVVRKFYEQYFRHFDRQIVLIDCLSPLNAGKDSFTELQRSIELLLKSYRYGHNNVIRRMFAPRIDKLLFAATKSDHITADQHDNLKQLLNELITGTRQDIQFEGITVDTLALSSIQATQNGFVKYQGRDHPCIKGIVNEGNKTSNEHRRTVTLYPGEVPTTLPDDAFWQRQHFEFIDFAPPYINDRKLAHIRMDQAIEFLLGDKLQ